MNVLADAVKVTLGPQGPQRRPREELRLARPVTKDGVTVAKEIELEDKFENMGAQMVKEVASKTSDVAGDGTTTATVLAQAIFNEGPKLVAAGDNPMEMKRGIDKAVDRRRRRAEEARPSPPATQKEIAQVGTVSANGDATIGNIIAEAMEKVGKDGVITVEEAKSLETTARGGRGHAVRPRLPLARTSSPIRSTMEVVLEDAYILIHEKKISNMKDLLPLLEQVATCRQAAADHRRGRRGRGPGHPGRQQAPRHPARAPPSRPPASATAARPCSRTSPSSPAARSISEDLGIKLENVTLTDLGRAKRIVIDKDNTTIIDGAGKKADIKARIEQIRGPDRGDHQRLRPREARRSASPSWSAAWP